MKQDLRNLMQTYNLSQELRKFCTTLTVQVISQQLTNATPEEQTILNIQENNSFIREVYLQGDGVNLVHARVIVPNVTYLKFKTELDNLGTNFLGESFLYKHQHTRSPFVYQQNSRRSVFDLSGYKLMVTEIFLDTITTQSRPLAKL